MKLPLPHLKLFVFLLFTCCASGQDITLYEQFNGRYDFTFVGNTLNPQENSYMETPVINTSSSADLDLNAGDVIEKAYLYWAGSGMGDFQVKLNGQTFTPTRTFSYHRIVFGGFLDYFSAFADVTSLVQSTGSGTYTLSELDVTDYIVEHFANRTNFAGWALVIVYKNENLPLNQLNMYDGMQAVPQEIIITLNSLNVIDNQDAKIGFLAWEGDENLNDAEILQINEQELSNPPLNPEGNAFNGTNSINGSDDLYNMDLDVYNIENNIQPGNTTAEIKLSSGADFVMINAILTKLNSQLPDATIVVDSVASACRSLEIVVDYTVYNTNSTSALPAGIPVSAYVNGVFVGETITGAAIPIGGSQTGQITVTIPENTESGFELTLVVDDNGEGDSTIVETDETNNADNYVADLVMPPPFNIPPDLEACNLGLGSALFDFSDYASIIQANPDQEISFYHSEADAQNNIDPIFNTSSFTAESTPKQIFVRIDNDDCYSFTSFTLDVKNCPPVIYNYVSVNGDGSNDTFHIDGLRDVFLNYKLSVYNRWGVLIWVGNNSMPEWDGYANVGSIVIDGRVPDGTYYYILELNDPGYTEPFTGFVYIN
ncbi:MAG TPA: gliding motility-associated C-terminal domain-containing protein [Flavobacterium sp.]